MRHDSILECGMQKFMKVMKESLGLRPRLSCFFLASLLFPHFREQVLFGRIKD